MNVWADPIRTAPSSEWTRYTNAANVMIKTGDAGYVSLCYDLGNGLTGKDLIGVMVASGTWPKVGVCVHEPDTSRRQEMVGYLLGVAPGRVKVYESADLARTWIEVSR